jgi:hypothetical protein
MSHGIERRGKRIDAKRRECYQAAGRVETCEKQLLMIEARSRHDQLSQLHPASEEIAWRSGGNPHIYGVTADPQAIDDMIRNPGNHIRELSQPSAGRNLSGRIHEIRDRSKAGGNGKSVLSDDRPVVPATEHFDVDLAGMGANGDQSAA